MQTLMLESDNTEALEAIKMLAKVLNIKTSEKDDNKETNEYYYLNGIKVRKGKGKIDIKTLSGSFPNLDMDPETYRKTLWSRNKE